MCYTPGRTQAALESALSGIQECMTLTPCSRLKKISLPLTLFTNDTTVPPEDHSVTVVTKFADGVQWLRNGSYLIRCVVSISTLRHRVDTFFSSV